MPPAAARASPPACAAITGSGGRRRPAGPEQMRLDPGEVGVHHLDRARDLPRARAPRRVPDGRAGRRRAVRVSRCVASGCPRSPLAGALDRAVHLEHELVAARGDDRVMQREVPDLELLGARGRGAARRGSAASRRSRGSWPRPRRAAAPAARSAGEPPSHPPVRHRRTGPYPDRRGCSLGEGPRSAGTFRAPLRARSGPPPRARRARCAPSSALRRGRLRAGARSAGGVRGRGRARTLRGSDRRAPRRTPSRATRAVRPPWRPSWGGGFEQDSARWAHRRPILPILRAAHQKCRPAIRRSPFPVDVH